MKRTVIISLSVLILIVCFGLGIYSYFVHTSFDLAKKAYEHQVKDQFQEGIAAANDSLWYRSNNDLALYVRGICTFKLMGDEKGDKLPGLAKAKADLKRALELTKDEKLAANCKEFLGRIQAYEVEMSKQ